MSTQNFTQSLKSGAARGAIVVTPDTNNDLVNFATRGLLVTVTTLGTLVIDPVDGAPNQNLGTLPVGVWSIPVQARRVRATGTLVGVITALY